MAALAEGLHSVTILATDAAGNVSAATAAVNFTVDTLAPAAPLALTVTDDVALVTGTVANGGSTNDNLPTFSGAAGNAEAGAVINVYDGATLLGSTTAAADGSWSYTPAAALATGAHSITAKATDAAGNVGAASAASTFTVDTTAPTQTATISALTDDMPLTVGTVAAGGTTNDTTPTLTGTISAALGAGEVVAVYLDGTKVGNATMTTATAWTFTDSNVPDGAHTYTVRIEDAAGNQSVSAPTRAFTEDGTAPVQTITVTAVADNVSPVTGALNSGDWTNDTTPAFSGTLSAALDAGETLAVYLNGTYVTTATVTGTTWSYTSAALANGSTNNFTFVVQDAAGNQGAFTSPFTLNVDSAAPAQTITISALTDDVPLVTGNIAAGGTTNDASPVLSGTLSAVLGANDVLVVYRDGLALGNATVTTTNWTYSDTNVPDGAHTYTVQVQDLAGNVSVSAPTRAFTVDTGVPTQVVTVTDLADNVANYTGSVASGDYTNDTTPTFAGTLSAALGAGETLAVYRNGVYVTTATVTGTTWTYVSAALTNGNSYDFTFVVQDTASNQGPVSDVYNVKIDTGVPAQTSAITSYTDDVGPTSGNVASGGVSNDTTPLLGGTISAALGVNESVHIYRDGVDVGTATVTGTTWTFQETGLALGTHSYTARVEDLAHNQAAASAAYSVTTGTSEPLTATGTSYSTAGATPVSNVGDVNNDGFDDFLVSFNATSTAAYVVYGNAAGTLPTKAQLDANTGGFVISIPATSSICWSPWAASFNWYPSWAGDVNADGKTDFFVADVNYAYLMQGQSSYATGMNVNTTSTRTAFWEYDGSNSSYTQGSGVGDMNGDGLMDVASQGTGNGSTALYVAYGQTSMPTTSNNGASLSSFSVSRDSRITGFNNYAYSNAGINMTNVTGVGDVNGDGLADMASVQGIVYGHTTGQNTAITMGVGSLQTSFYMPGNSGNAPSSSYAAGDVNGDGYADVIIVGNTLGAAYVVFGGASLPSTTVSYSGIGSTQAGFKIIDTVAGDNWGVVDARVVGDLNGDGLSDIAVDLRTSASGHGTAYIVYGQTDMTQVDLANVRAGLGGFAVNGSASITSMANVSSAGDLNGDGVGDLVFGGSTAAFAVHYGGADTGFVADVSGTNATGTIASELIQGTSGVDVLTGNGGTDVIYAGAGNDTIHLNSSNLAALAAGYDATAQMLARVDGGNGVDTLAFDGAGVSMDMSTMSNVGVTGGISSSRIANIERIDLTGSGDNSLTLKLNDVMDMNIGFNLFNDSNGWNGLGATVSRHQMVIDGDAGDQLTVNNSVADWTTTPVGQVTNNGHTYDVYNSVKTNAGQLLVDQQVTVIFG